MLYDVIWCFTVRIYVLCIHNPLMKSIISMALPIRKSPKMTWNTSLMPTFGRHREEQLTQDAAHRVHRGLVLAKDEFGCDKLEDTMKWLLNHWILNGKNDGKWFEHYSIYLFVYSFTYVFNQSDFGARHFQTNPFAIVWSKFWLCWDGLSYSISIKFCMHIYIHISIYIRI